MKKSLIILLAVLLLVSVTGCNTATTQGNNTGGATNSGAYPSKPVLAIIAFDPGGGTDIAARTIFRFAEKYLGQPMVVENRPGGGGTIGWSAIAHAETDGYTIGMINPPSLLFNPITLGDKVNYTLADFQPIANFVSDPGAIVVSNDSEFQTLQDIIDYAKANPDELRLGYSGPGTSEALTIRRLEQTNGLTMRKIPFDGTGPMLTALMGDNADIIFCNASEIVTQYSAKQVRVIAIGAEERISLMPDVPTYRESGFDQVQIAMRGLAVPAGVDPEVVKVLAEAMEKTFSDPEFVAEAAKLNLPLDYLGPEEFKAKLEKDDAFYREQYAINPW